MITARKHGAAFESQPHYLTRDRDRLDALLDEIRTHVYNAEWALARRDCGAFARGLERHLLLEEQVLFPLFEQRTGCTTADLREEHDRIRAAVRTMVASVGRGDGAGFRLGLAALLSVLPDHNTREEGVLYPATHRERLRPGAAVPAA